MKFLRRLRSYLFHPRRLFIFWAADGQHTYWATLESQGAGTPTMTGANLTWHLLRSKRVW